MTKKEAGSHSDADTGTARDPTASEASNTARDPSVEHEAASAVRKDEPVVAEKPVEAKPLKEYSNFGTPEFGNQEIDMIEVMEARKHAQQVKSSAELKKERKAKKSDRK